MSVVIYNVNKKSYAQKAGIKSGDTLISINGNEINDILDYQFYATDKKLFLELLDCSGKPYSAAIKKGEYDELGLEFQTYLIDKQQHCKNKCVFCFIDQMPKGMRETLYFKDDDARMSFLFGNYITLTNLQEKDIERIIKMKISPVNISVHTTDPELRIKMMKNPRAGECLKYIKMLADGGIKVNTQLVLCPEINDGEQLKRSLNDLGALYPNLQSIACVPVGLTDYREGLAQLRPFTKDEAINVVNTINAFADNMQAKYGERVAYPADEFFLKAELPIPAAEYYGEFNQLENGVGLLASLNDELNSALNTAEPKAAKADISIATGAAAYSFICGLCDKIKSRYPEVSIKVYKIINDFFGHNITVAGLVTGTDLIKQLKGKPLGEKLLIPSVMLRHEQDKFLDDITLEQLEQELGIDIITVDNDGFDMLDKIIGT
ncbi:MAG TPA: radical SAM protein [Ruminococcaceae bacterium]|nr:radical SAM protein [Oscillospiraceae bacterium]